MECDFGPVGSNDRQCNNNVLAAGGESFRNGGKGGQEAANLEIAKQYVAEFGKLAKENNTLIIPSDVNNVSSMLATAMSVFDNVKKK